MGYYDVFSEGKRRRRKLENIEVEEISLVDQPANGLRFAIIKRAGATLSELLKGFDSSKMSEDAGEAIKKALQILLAYKEDFPAEILESIQVLAKFVEEGYGYPKAGPDGGPLVAKRSSGAGRWPSFTISKGGFAGLGGRESAIPGDDDFPGRVPDPHKRGVSKAIKGQGDETIEDKELWPSL